MIPIMLYAGLACSLGAMTYMAIRHGDHTDFICVAAFIWVTLVTIMLTHPLH